MYLKLLIEIDDYMFINLNKESFYKYLDNFKNKFFKVIDFK